MIGGLLDVVDTYMYPVRAEPHAEVYIQEQVQEEVQYIHTSNHMLHAN